MRADIFSTTEKAAGWVAGEMANEMKKKQGSGEICILGLTTEATSLGVYSKLIRLHKADGLSFQNVVTFNLNEIQMAMPVSSEELRHKPNVILGHPSQMGNDSRLFWQRSVG